MKYIPILILSLFLCSCSTFKVTQEDTGAWGIKVYKLSDGKTSITYLSSMCPCIADEVLKQVKKDLDDGLVQWLDLQNENYAKQYLEYTCRQLLKQ
ncbi:MAG: hypothetical protein IMZ53_00470 [Thermoplasmata archaeon]|nr:hypothetical protein [Thermoplasmata archaeon]